MTEKASSELNQPDGLKQVTSKVLFNDMIKNQSSTDGETDVRLEEIPLVDISDDSAYDLGEAWFLIKKAVPVSLTYFMQYSLQIAGIFSLGHLGSVELAASALASMYAGVTGFSVALGAASALETLCSQAWTSGNPKMVGIYLQRALLIIMIGFFPIAISWWEVERILVFLGQDKVLANKAGLFLRYLLIGAPAYIAFECLKKYLQAQGIMKASTYVLAVCSIINLILNYSLVWYKPISLGFIGAPVATSITYWLMFLLLFLYTVYLDGYQAWGGWTRTCLQDWNSFLRLAFPSVLMVCAEWWAFELVTFAAGYLGPLALATQSVVLTTASLVYQIPFGIAVSTSNRIGNFLGAGLPGRAKMTAKMSLALSVISALCNSSILFGFRNHWGYLFSNDAEVIVMVASILPLCASFQIADGIAGIGDGILRGQGRQKIGAIFNLFGYYLAALPLGLSLAFKYGFGLKGLWLGLTLASFLIALGTFWAVITTNWNWEVAKCQRRKKNVEMQFQSGVGGRRNCTNLEEGSNQNYLDNHFHN
ncbi:hypothetical protein G9A89_019871 [Geosiphon pyriformis]|nr:hypothetical protein G9A89_019871 [Geosiphon pyriformis]